MKVKRIVANVQAKNIGDAKRFYEDILGLEQLMDLGWIATYGSNTKYPNTLTRRDKPVLMAGTLS